MDDETTPVYITTEEEYNKWKNEFKTKNKQNKPFIEQFNNIFTISIFNKKYSNGIYDPINKTLKYDFRNLELIK
jgi:hypothetical protein